MAALITLAIIIGWGISHTILFSHHSNKLASVVDQYGANISSLVSDQLAYSVSQTDLISAQATAQSIVRKAAVSSIIIYDNNNQILAQAIGLNSSANSPSKKYASPILSGENIIGSTTVTIQSDSFDNTSQTMPEIWWVASLFFLSIIFLIKDIFSKSKEETITHQLGPKKQMGKDNAKDSNPTIIDTQKTDDTIIYVTITIDNIDTLYRQLNRELIQQQMLLLDKNITHTTNLYGGKKLVVDEQKVVLIFNQKNIENAIYSQQLLLDLHKKNKKSMITMSGLIMESGRLQSISSTFVQLKSLTENKKLYCSHIQTEMIDKHSLDTHLQYMKTEDSFATTISGLQPHYQQLLDSQMTQLLKNDG
jgi:hypothetical protein